MLAAQKKDFRKAAFVRQAEAPTRGPAVLLRVEKFAMTANVVGYAMAGASMGYFDFFPVSASSADVFGAVPTWGIAVVVGSDVKALPVGTRVYGIVPIGPSFVAFPSKLTDKSFVCSAAHRAKRDIIYNTYHILRNDSLYPGPAREEHMILYRPLFLTAFLLRDVVARQDVETVFITSASSKTAVCLAVLVQRMPHNQRPKVVGLTSSRNFEFVKAQGAFDKVCLYQNAKSELDALLTKRYMVVDFACDVEILKLLQRPQLVCMSIIGATHQGRLGDVLRGSGFRDDLVKPAFFFAPHAAAETIERLGSEAAFSEAVRVEFLAFLQGLDRLKIERATNENQALKCYEGYVNGTIPAEESWIGMLPPKAGM